MRARAAFAAAVVSLVSTVVVAQTAEPRHEGRTAKEWIADFAGDDVMKTGTAMAAVEAIGAPAVPALLAALTHADAGVRGPAAVTLGKIGGSGVAAALVRAAETDGEFANRLQAAAALAGLARRDDKEAAPALGALVARLMAGLEGTSADAADDAQNLLGHVGVAAREKLVAAALTHARPEVRVRAVVSLRDVKEGVAPALLRAAAEDKDPTVRAAAVGMLGLLAMDGVPETTEIVAALRRAQKDADESVRRAAANALENAGTR